MHLLNLFCIDEIHLFIEFGCSFPTSFQLLRDRLFSIFKVTETNSTVPLLLMTATFNHHLLYLLQLMIGYQITPTNIFWAPTCDFQKRHILIEASYSLQHFNQLKKAIKNSIEGNDSHKCIIITNTAKRANECKESIDSWLDSSDDIKGDSILVIGKQQTELKFAYTTAFTNTPFDSNEQNIDNNIQPRFLVGTSGCIGAGLDSPDVHLVMRIGISPSIIDFIQEMGRCGRMNYQQSLTIASDIFSIVFSIHDYVYLYERIFIEKEQINQDESDSEMQNNLMSKKKYREIEVYRLNSVCSMMLLQFGCWHKFLERESSNPYVNYNDMQSQPCMHFCPYCTNEINEIVKTVSRMGLCRFLADVMLNSSKRYTPIELGDKLYKYPNSGTLIYGRKSAERPEKKSDCYDTIIQLLLVGILNLTIEPSPNPTALCTVTKNDIEPMYLNNAVWTNIQHY